LSTAITVVDYAKQCMAELLRPSTLNFKWKKIQITGERRKQNNGIPKQFEIIASQDSSFVFSKYKHRRSGWGRHLISRAQRSTRAKVRKLTWYVIIRPLVRT
ncbi:hypothetical protein PanWU01x14_119440, partial [Parasponia andersonii]